VEESEAVVNTVPTIDCEFVRKNIVAFIFANLPQDLYERVEQHLAACGECNEARMQKYSVDCKLVQRELSNFIDGVVDPELRARMQEHFHKCSHCLALYDGTRNVIKLYADDAAFEIPAGFGKRLFRKVNEHLDE
jgi:predicted anti-sigma-YlaC factor YlaD